MTDFEYEYLDAAARHKLAELKARSLERQLVNAELEVPGAGLVRGADPAEAPTAREQAEQRVERLREAVLEARQERDRLLKEAAPAKGGKKS